MLGAGLSGLGIGPCVLHAQSNAPYYEVAEIQVTDQPAYEASGVVEIRDMLKKNGVKVIAGGYQQNAILRRYADRQPLSDLPIPRQGDPRQGVD